MGIKVIPLKYILFSKTKLFSLRKKTLSDYHEVWGEGIDRLQVPLASLFHRRGGR
jgi:hypothetical protein